MSHQTIRIDLGSRSYDIQIGSGLIAQAGASIKPLLKQPRVIVVTDTNVGPRYLEPLRQSLALHEIKVESVTLPAGESTKSFAHLESLMQQLLALQPDRKTTLIALGGGVIGDITGFAASILLRGVPFIQIPTSLLAQVDSSVGGKTGINTSQGKNLVGTFYQPKLVLIDTDVLSTLPPREMQAGYAEIVKYGLINQPDFFSWLEKNGTSVLSHDGAALTHAIRVSCASKADIVARDETENDLRALLNLGHTFGHALEAETGFSSVLLHGEAVAIGMVMAFQYSSMMGLSPQQDTLRIISHFESLGIQTSPKQVRAAWNADRIIAHFYQDKKVTGGTLTFILARGIGKAFVSHDVSEESLRKALAELI